MFKKEEESQKDEGLIKDRYELIFKELQNILAFGYLCLIIIGMVYEAVYYSLFQINIFEYSEVLDFLLAPFRRPLTIVYLGIAGLIVLVGFILDKWLQKLPRAYSWTTLGMGQKSWYNKFRVWSAVLTFLFLVVVYAFAVGNIEYQNVRNNKEADIEVHLAESAEVILGRSIGKNGSYLFLLNQEEKVILIPINNDVKYIRSISNQ